MPITPRNRTRQVDVTSGEKIVATKGYKRVRRANYSSGTLQNEEFDDNTVDIPVFCDTPAYIKVAGGITRNMGDFNSVRVDVELTLPCLPEITEIDRAYLLASETVDSLLTKELSIAEGQ